MFPVRVTELLDRLLPEVVNAVLTDIAKLRGNCAWRIDSFFRSPDFHIVKMGVPKHEDLRYVLILTFVLILTILYPLLN